MLPIIIILAAAGGLIVSYYTDNWLAQYTAKVYHKMNLDLYVANSIAVIRSTSSTLLQQQHFNEFASAGEFIGPELLELDLKEHWYLQAPPTITVASDVVSIPSASLALYYFGFAVLILLVIGAVFICKSAAFRAQLSIICLSILPFFGGVQPIAEAAARIPLFKDITDVAPTRAYSLAHITSAKTLTSNATPVEGSTPLPAEHSPPSAESGKVELDSPSTSSTADLPATLMIHVTDSTIASTSTLEPTTDMLVPNSPDCEATLKLESSVQGRLENNLEIQQSSAFESTEFNVARVVNSRLAECETLEHSTADMVVATRQSIVQNLIYTPELPPLKPDANLYTLVEEEITVLIPTLEVAGDSVRVTEQVYATVHLTNQSEEETLVVEMKPTTNFVNFVRQYYGKIIIVSMLLVMVLCAICKVVVDLLRSCRSIVNSFRSIKHTIITRSPPVIGSLLIIIISRIIIKAICWTAVSQFLRNCIKKAGRLSRFLLMKLFSSTSALTFTTYRHLGRGTRVIIRTSLYILSTLISAFTLLFTINFNFYTLDSTSSLRRLLHQFQEFLYLK